MPNANISYSYQLLPCLFKASCTQLSKPEIPCPTKLLPVDQQGSVRVNKYGDNRGQGGTPRLGGSTGPDPFTGFDAGER